MEPSARAEHIQTKLIDCFEAVHVEVEDESHLHAGHAGAREGKGHFRVVVVSEKFSDCSRVQAQRLIFAALAEEMKSDIHALTMQTYTPEEWQKTAGC